MVKETLLKAPGLSRSRCTGSRRAAPVEAATTTSGLRKLFPARRGFPRFDLVLLGLRTGRAHRLALPHSPGLAEAGLGDRQLGGAARRIDSPSPIRSWMQRRRSSSWSERTKWALHEVLRAVHSVRDVPPAGALTQGALTFLVDRAAAAGLGQMSA